MHTSWQHDVRVLVTALARFAMTVCACVVGVFVVAVGAYLAIGWVGSLLHPCPEDVGPGRCWTGGRTHLGYSLLATLWLTVLIAGGALIAWELTRSRRAGRA